MKDEIKEILDYLKPKYDIVDELGNDYKKVKFKDCKLLLDYITNLQEENERLRREKIQKELCESLLDECDAHNKYLQQRIDKAIEYIMTELITEWDIKNDGHVSGSDLPVYAITPLLNILQGENNNE